MPTHSRVGSLLGKRSGKAENSQSDCEVIEDKYLRCRYLNTFAFRHSETFSDDELKEIYNHLRSSASVFHRFLSESLSKRQNARDIAEQVGLPLPKLFETTEALQLYLKTLEKQMREDENKFKSMMGEAVEKASDQRL